MVVPLGFNIFLLPSHIFYSDKVIQIAEVCPVVSYTVCLLLIVFTQSWPDTSRQFYGYNPEGSISEHLLLRIVFQRPLLWQAIVIVSAHNQTFSMKCNNLSFETDQFKIRPPSSKSKQHLCLREPIWCHQLLKCGV